MNNKNNNQLDKLVHFIIVNDFKPENILTRNAAGHTALTLAIKNKLDINFIAYLIETDKYGVIVNRDYQQNINGSIKCVSPLSIALQQKSPEVVLLLLKKNADFNELIGKDKKTIYEYLTEPKYKDIFIDKKWDEVRKFLIAKGAHNNTSTYYVPHAPIETLVFEGAGARGVVYPGAIKALEERGVLNSVKRIGGVSSGSIVSLLLALGYNSKELDKFMNEANFKKFMIPAKKSFLGKISSGVLNFFGNIFRKLKIFSKFDMLNYGLQGIFNKKRGAFRVKAISNWLDDKIYQAIGIRNATFKDLQNAKKTNPKIKYLYIELCNLTTRKGEVWSHENHPNGIVANVVAASCTFPLAFQVTNMKVNGKYYSYADGGIYDNCPVISMFNSEQYLPKGYNFDKQGANPGVCIIKVDNTNEVNNLLWNKGSGRKSAKYGKWNFIMDVVSSFGVKQQFVAEKYPTRIIQIHDGDISTLDFQLTDKQKELAKKRGYKAAKNYLELYRGMGTCYFMYNPKYVKDKKLMNLIDRSELKAFSSLQELKSEEQSLLKQLDKIRISKGLFFKGRSISAQKRSLNKRLIDIRMMKNRMKVISESSVEKNLKSGYKTKLRSA